MTTTPDATSAAGPFDGWSDGDLRSQVLTIQQEQERRATEDATVRDERLRRELAEVKAGQRPARKEHILMLSPAETTDLLETGHLKHLGFGARRRGRQ